jgi:hypothetical protein
MDGEVELRIAELPKQETVLIGEELVGLIA